MESKIFIETDRLLLRQWKETDCSTYISMNLDKEVMEYFPSLLSEVKTRQHIDSIQLTIEQNGYGLFAIERKDTHSFIGFTGFAHPKFEAAFTPCVEIGWRLARDQWGMGFATEAAKACLAYGFRTLQFSAIHSFTSVLNTRSEQVMKKIGMQKNGEFDHPLLEEGHYLQKHVLYTIYPNEFLCTRN